ncbi:protein phosphatase 2C domain-containing protein, partial [Pseudonocardia acaciae]|uniref:protein phosphatase 2C domain-containing protein n=1 Tax=Pseudonocardia acaciae TaxID=551276 RepID=UPI000563C92C
AARFWNWIRVHDLKPLNGKPWNFISQTQFGIGIGPRWSPIPHTQLPNFIEYRGSLQKLTYSNNGADSHTIHMVNDIGPKLGARIARLLPWLLRRDPNTDWSPVWGDAMAKRQAAYHNKLRRRGLEVLRQTVHAQRAQLGRVTAELARTEDQIRALTATGMDPLAGLGMTGQPHPVAALRWRAAHLRRLRAQLLAAITENFGRMRAFADYSGSPTGVLDPPAPTHRVPQPTQTGPNGELTTGGPPADGTQPDGTQSRLGFELPGVAGRSDSGHPENRNFDAMGAIVTPGGRVIAAVADQQGYAKKPTPVSQVAVGAALGAVADALATDPNTPADQLAQLAFDAAAAAAEPGDQITTFLLVVATPTGPNSNNVVFIRVGDSRGYTVDATGTEQVGTDHTWGVTNTAETAPDNQPRQQITRWIGAGPAHTPAMDSRDIDGPAYIVLTTDELHDFYPNPDDLGAVVLASGGPTAAADALIDNVLTRGSGNKTAVVIQLNTGMPAPHTPGGAPAPARRPAPSAPPGTILSRAHRTAVTEQLRKAIVLVDAPYLEAGRRLAGALPTQAEAEAGVTELHERGVRWLFAGDESLLTRANIERVADELGMLRSEVAALATDPTVPAEVTGLGAPDGSFDQRLARLVTELNDRTAKLDAATDEVTEARAALARADAARTTAVEAAVRRAARRGLSVPAIARITSLSRAEVRRILGHHPGGGPTGGGPTGGG